MDLDLLVYQEESGWSRTFPAWDGSSTLVLVFAAPRWLVPQGPLQALRDAFPSSILLGCSTAGEIQDSFLHSGSMTVALVRFAKTRLRLARADAMEAGAFAAGQSVGEALVEPDLRSVLVLAGGVGVNGSDLVRGLRASLPEEVMVSGGLAGDGSDFRRTFVLGCGPEETLEVVPEGLAAVGFYGDSVQFGYGSGAGWNSFGLERRVTRSHGNVLFEMDGKPALDLYRSYLGDRASGLPATALLFPLALRKSGKEQQALIRTIVGIEEDSQSLTFAGEIPEGSFVQLMCCTMDRLVEGAAEAARQAGAGCSGPCLSLAVSCVGRRVVLGERTEEELEAAQEALPDGSRQVGFYSYGELSPVGSGICSLHNQTMTITTIREA